MCLSLNEKRLPSVAEHDIICYKVLQFRKQAHWYFYETPYAEMLVSDRIISGEKNLKPWPEIRITGPMQNISQGFIHTYANLEHAKLQQAWLSEKQAWLNEIIRAYDIFKCIIPKGTKFYDGECFAGPEPVPGFASLEIKFIEKI